MLNFGGVYRKFSKFFFGFFFWTPQKKTPRGPFWTEDSVRRFPIRLDRLRRFRFAGLDVETSALEAGKKNQVLGIGMDMGVS